MQSTNGDDIQVGDTVWFAQDGHEARPAAEWAAPEPTLDSGRVVVLDESGGGMEVDTGQGRELIGLYAVHFVQTLSE